MNDLNFEIYENKTFKDVCKDIFDRSEQKKIQVDVLFTSIRQYIKDQNSALMFVPQLKGLLDTGIKNDEQLIKLAMIFQRIQSTQLEVNGGGSIGLSEEEKAQLLREVDTIRTEVNSPISKSINI